MLSKSVSFDLHGVEITVPFVLVKAMRHRAYLTPTPEKAIRQEMDQAVWRTCKALAPTAPAIMEALDDPKSGMTILLAAAALLSMGKKSHPEENPCADKKN